MPTVDKGINQELVYKVKVLQWHKGDIGDHRTGSAEEREQLLNDYFCNGCSLNWTDAPLDETMRSFPGLYCDWNELVLFCSPLK